jgi:PAS domain S-box-containing protein
MENQIKPPSKWITAGLIVAISGVMILLGYIYLINQIRGIREVTDNQLTSIAQLKISEISHWREERMSDLWVTLESPMFRESVVELAANPNKAALREDLTTRLESLITHANYWNSYLVYPDGTILISAKPPAARMEEAAVLNIHTAVESERAFFSDFFHSELDGRVYLDLIGPVKNENGQVTAVLLLRVDPEQYLYPLIQTWPTPSESAETLIVRREGDAVLFLNTLRHRPDAPLTIQIPLSRDEVPGVKVVKGLRGSTEGIDYRGVEVFAAVNPIPDSEWFIVSKIDRREIRDQIIFISGFILLMVVMGILLTAALLVVYFNRRQRILYRDMYNAEKGRLKALEETRTILYSIGDGVIATDEHGRVTHINPVAVDLTGWKEEDGIGRDLSEVFSIINEKTLEKVENPAKQVLRDGNIVGLANHTLLVRRDGRKIPIADSGAPVKDTQGDIHGVVLVFRDQTGERETQRELYLLSNTIRASLDEIYIFDADTLRFRFVNDGALKNLGFSLEEMQEKTPLDIKPEMDEAKFRQMVKPLLDHSLPIQVFETIHQRSDGSCYPVEVHLQLHEDESGNDGRLFMAMIQDITRRRQDEEAIQKLNADLEQRVIDRTIQLQASNKELEAFAYSISHDLRGPLRGIDGWGQALLEDNFDQLNPTGREYLNRVRGETQRMGRLIDDLLELSRVTRIEMTVENVDLTTMANNIIAGFRIIDNDRDVEFTVEENLAARGDPRLLEIALTDLLDNAWKFTGAREKARIEFGSKVWDGRQVFFIRDNGVGFDMDYSARLFGAFQRLHKQTEFPGMGIGLATAQRIIQRHGGTIWPESKPGEGATFFFTLMEME